MINIRTFVVNLEFNLDRRNYMLSLLEGLGQKADFIKAVDGKRLSEKDLSTIYDKEEALRNLGRELTLGEIGCALSHIEIYKIIVEKNISYALILEDDISINFNLSKVIGNLIKVDKWDLILLGHHSGLDNDYTQKSELSFWGRVKILPDYKICRLCGKGYGTYGYIITLNGAKKLLSQTKLITKPIDFYTSDSSILNVYALDPVIITPKDTLSEQSEIYQERKLAESEYLDKYLHLSKTKRLVVIVLKRLGLLKIFLKINRFRKKLVFLKKYD